MRKRLSPINRLNWRDPNMPCLRLAKPYDNPDAPWRVYAFPPDVIHEYHKRAMLTPRVEPMWRHDPSYFWSEKKK